MPLAASVTCSGCGSQVPAGDRFCGTCGSPITGSALLSGEGQRFDPWTELLQKLRQATLGEYEIKGELGRGGMAAVFLAHDLHLNRKVAVKVMLPGLVYTERMWERFLAEARTAAKLDHPNIVYIHSVREKDRFLYFVMKYIDGRSLDGMLAQHSPFPIPVAQTILAEVARALDYAHREGVVHRDIKPANIMIDHKGEAVVMDFGIARVADSQHFTQTGATIGTPAYMSPEQCHGRETTAASDQYSVGVLAYEMFAGAPPFKGTPIELQVAHMQEKPIPLRDLRPDLSIELSGAIMQMLEKDPANRWATLHHLVPIFGRGLDHNDEAPRNHLISMVRTERHSRKSFPATPVSPTPGGGAGERKGGLAPTPLSTYAVRPSGATVHTDPAELLAIARAAGAARDAAATSGPQEAQTVISGPQPLAAAPASPAPAVPSSPLPVSPRAASAPITGGTTEPIDPSRPTLRLPPELTRWSRAIRSKVRSESRGLVIALGVVAVAAFGIVLAEALRSKAPDGSPPASSAASDPVQPAPTAALAVAAALGDSVAIGHGSDAALLVRGKAPRAVTPDAIALLKITLAKPRLAVGDTVHVRLEAFDDAGERVTSPQIVWTTSDPRVARFAAPGELVAVSEGRATIAVSAAATNASHQVTVAARPPPQMPRSAAQGTGKGPPKGQKRPF